MPKSERRKSGTSDIGLPLPSASPKSVLDGTDTGDSPSAAPPELASQQKGVGRGASRSFVGGGDSSVARFLFEKQAGKTTPPSMKQAAIGRRQRSSGAVESGSALRGGASGERARFTSTGDFQPGMLRVASHEGAGGRAPSASFAAPGQQRGLSTGDSPLAVRSRSQAALAQMALAGARDTGAGGSITPNSAPIDLTDPEE